MPHEAPQSASRLRRPGIADPGGGLDLIGDIHGHADVLDRLLEALGYRNLDGVPHHPTRTAIFLGDYIDRGPNIRRTLERVRDMVDRGDAIALMGNHEYNAIAWFTPRPDRPEVPCRRHTPIRRRLIEPTLRAIGPERDDWLDWMRRLPLWLESDRLRAVHACWNERAARHLQELLEPSNGVLEEAPMQATCEPGTESSRAIEQLLKGEEIPLPAEMVMTDPEGSPRRHIRARWFESPVGRTYRDYAMTTDDRFPSVEIPPDAIPADFVPYGPDERPIFVGHYWMRGGVPRRLAPNVACLDWSVARDGPLAAYRFDGEPEIEEKRFVAVS
ncbi:MAG: metallophosphoesterase [Planctomycetota bacterium]|nr:metallophosphoesterase [Planctomycetota bacterium]